MFQSKLDKFNHNGIQFIKHIESELGLTMFYTVDLMNHTSHEIFRSTGTLEDFELLIDKLKSKDCTLSEQSKLNQETISQVHDWILWARDGLGISLDSDLQVRCLT